MSILTWRRCEGKGASASWYRGAAATPAATMQHKYTLFQRFPPLASQHTHADRMLYTTSHTQADLHATSTADKQRWEKKTKCAWWPRCALLNTHILPAAQYKYIYARMDFLGGFCNLKGCLENYLSKWAKVDPPPSSTTWECVGSWSHNTVREHFAATFTSQALILLITQLLLIKLVNAGLSPSIIECFSHCGTATFT